MLSLMIYFVVVVVVVVNVDLVVVSGPVTVTYVC